MEEDTVPPRRNDTLLLGGMRATWSTSMRFTEPRGRTEEPPVPPRRSTRSSVPPPYTPRYSTYGFIILSEKEEIEGPIRRTPKGGSEWEPIKILIEGDGDSYKTNTASNTLL
jgi:hypothetical protein